MSTGQAVKPQTKPDLAAMQREPLPAARPDLLISPQLYLGRTVYVVKDPISLSYFRLKPQEHFILRKLDGTATAQQLAELASQKFPDQPVGPEQVLRFATMLQSASLLRGKDLSHAPRLREMQRRRKRLRQRASVFNFLFFKLCLLDPDRLLNAMHRSLGWLMNGWTLAAALVFMAISCSAAVVGMWRVDTLAMPILSWQNLMLLTVMFFAVKLVHEFGHGLAAKHYGLEVHEMGVLFMIFMPMFYVDVSDAWMLPRKANRIWINVGGMFVEFLFASAAAWVWLATEPGWVNQAAFNTMLAASVTTLLFNANPLLRYDGYYVLMDWMEIPNLRAKASQFMAYVAKRYVMAVQNLRPPAEAMQRPIFMVVYAIASSIYRWLVTIGIVAMAWQILDAYGLEVISAFMGMAALTMMIILPIIKMLKAVWTLQTQTARRLIVSAAAIAVLAAVLAGLASLPLEATVDQPIIVLAPERQPLFAPIAGKVEQVFYEDGQLVEKGQPLLRLSDPALETRLATMRVEREQALLELNHQRSQAHTAEVAASLLQLEQIDRQINWLEQRIAKLTIRAPLTGRLIANRRLQTLFGEYLQQGEQLGLMIAAGKREVLAVVPQADASRLREGMTAEIRLWPDPAHALEGTVVMIERQLLSRMPHESLSSLHGGDVESILVDQQHTAPSRPSVVARIELNDAQLQDLPLPLLDGTTGWGRIVTGRSSLGWQQYQKLRQATNLDWWL